MKKSNLFLTVILILAGFGWILLSRVPPEEQASTRIQAPQVGFLAPDFELSTLAGGTVALPDLRGKVVLINFWASWCPPCKAEMPAFQAAADEFGPEEVIILGINATSQDRKTDVEKFVDQYQLTFSIPLDISGEISRTYQVYSLPTTFFVSPDGQIEEVLIGGPIPLSLLRVKINELLLDGENAANN